jgi:hypothetical protein
MKGIEMDALWLTIYILMWPAIAIAVLALIWVAAGREMYNARLDRKDVV